MTPEEKNLISGLFDRLSQASDQPKDLEADQLIRSKVSENPGAPYVLAQSVLVMQQALGNAQNRIAALEKQIAEASSKQETRQGGGSFLSGVASLFGGGQQQRATPPPPPPSQAAPPPQAPPIVPLQAQQPQGYGYPPPPPSSPQQAPRPGGGFLQGALTTAAGVAGGTLLVQGIENLIGHNPGPFSGTFAPSGGEFGGERPVEETTEVVNNYYTEPEPNRDQFDQNVGDRNVVDDSNADSNAGLTDTDYSSDDNDTGGDDFGGGGDDSSYV
jgi:uncharacterized protein